MPAGVELPPEGVDSFDDNARGKAEALAAARSSEPRRARCRTRPAPRRAPAGRAARGHRRRLGPRGRGAGRGAGRDLSARYAGREARPGADVANYAAPAARAGRRAGPARAAGARFVCSIAFVAPGVARSQTVRGEWPGAIAAAPRGDGGFGYDPLFVPAGLAAHRGRDGRGRQEPPRATARGRRGRCSRALRGGSAAVSNGRRPQRRPQPRAQGARRLGLDRARTPTLIAFKLVVGIISGSIAIISEALHSGSDLVASIIALVVGAGGGQAGRPVAPLRPREGREHLRRHRGRCSSSPPPSSSSSRPS